MAIALLKPCAVTASRLTSSTLKLGNTIGFPVARKMDATLSIQRRLKSTTMSERNIGSQFESSLNRRAHPPSDAQANIPGSALLSGRAEQIVGRERRERVSQLAWCGAGCFDSRRRVNSNVGLLSKMKVVLLPLLTLLGLSANISAQRLS